MNIIGFEYTFIASHDDYYTRSHLYRGERENVATMRQCDGLWLMEKEIRKEVELSGEKEEEENR